MKKFLLTMCCVLLMSQASFAEGNKIAVVDLQQIVNNSSQVKTLQKDRTMKLKELNKIITQAKIDIAKESDPKKILEIQDRYTAEFNTKKSAIDKNYTVKLIAIETKIKTEIKNKALKDGYNFVFAKSVALYGGKDITPEVLTMVNAVK